LGMNDTLKRANAATPYAKRFRRPAPIDTGNLDLPV
jgi:hypothetical protein